MTSKYVVNINTRTSKNVLYIFPVLQIDEVGSSALSARSDITTSQLIQTPKTTLSSKMEAVQVWCSKQYNMYSTIT